MEISRIGALWLIAGGGVAFISAIAWSVAPENKRTATRGTGRVTENIFLRGGEE
jgi:hypothetical protein